MSDIILTPAASRIIRADIGAYTRDGSRYASYVSEMNVTLDTVAAHVALFRDAYKKSHPQADGAAVKGYATKVRNGLNYALGKKGKKSASTALLTSAGKSATLDEVIAAWEAAQK